MKESLDNGKGFLKEKFADYRIDPPAEVWPLISGQLGRGNRGRVVLVILSAAATIALAVTLGITLLGPEPLERAQVTATEGASERRPSGQEFEVADGSSLKTGATSEEDRSLKTGATSEEDGSDMADKGSDTDGARPFDGSRSQVANANTGEPLVPSNGTPTRAEVSGIPVEKAARFQPAHAPVRDEISGEEVLAWITREGEAVTREGEAVTRKGEAVTREGEAANRESQTFTPVEETATGEGETVPGEREMYEEYRTEEESRENDHRWTLAAILSPQYSYRDAENQAASGLPVRESGLLTYAGGINVSYSPVSRLAVESGVFFNRMGVNVDGTRISSFESYIDMGPLNSEDAIPNLVSVSNTVGNIVTKSGEIYVNNYKLNSRNQADAFNYSSSMYSDQGIRQQLDYLEVPFNLRYTLIDKDLEVQLVGGVSTNLLINSHVTIETADGSSQVGYMTNIRNVNYTGNAGLGMIYHIAGNFSLRLEPRFRYFLNSINDPSLPATRPYAFGLFTGMSYLF